MAFSGFSGVGSNVAQQPFANVSIQTVSANSGPKVLSYDNIIRNAQNARDKNQYWQVANPSRNIKLTGAVNYVTRHYAGSTSDPFVYYPDLAMAGHVNAIYNMLASANVRQINVGELNRLTGGRFGNQAGSVPLDVNNILNNSFNPLNPQQADFLRSMMADIRSNVKQAQSKFTFDQHLQIAKGFKQERGNGRGGAAATGGVAKTTSATAGAGASKKLAERVGEFDALMTQVLQTGKSDQVIDVSAFDVSKYTNARRINPPTTSRTKVSVEITADGRNIHVPIVVNPSSIGNLDAYLRTVVASSRYASLASAIQQAFQRVINGQSISATFGTQAHNATVQLPVAGGFANAPAQFQQMVTGNQTLPGVTFQQMPQQSFQQSFVPQQSFQQGGNALASLGQGGPQITSPSGRPRTGNSPLASPAGGFQLPSASLPSMGPSFGASSPSGGLGGGFALPTLGGATGLPNITGLPSVTGLPTVGGGF